MIHGQISKIPKGNYSLEVHALKDSENQCPETEEYTQSNELPVSEHSYKVSIINIHLLRFEKIK